MDEKYLRLAIIAVILIIVLLILNKFGILGGVSREQIKNATDNAAKLKGTDPSYYIKVKNKKVTALPFGGAELSQLVRDLKASINTIGGLNEATVWSLVYKIKTQKQLSQVNNMYNIVYKRTFMTDLTNLLDSFIGLFAHKDLYTKIVDYLKSLPDA